MDVRDAFLRQNDRFVTREEEIARTTNTSGVYWRLGDPLCRQFLTAGAAEARQVNGASFAGTFFPFYRKASVLAFPRHEQSLPQWLLLSFFAGLAYGRRFPDEAEALFEANRPQEQAAWSFLTSLRKLLASVGIGRGRLTSALIRCCQRRRDCSEQDVPSQIIEHTQTAIWAGLLAATSAKNDVLQMEFLEGVKAAVPPSKFSLRSRLVIGAAVEANKRPVLDLLLHPLLDLAAEKYADSPLEGALILRYLNDKLRQLRHASEEDCPTRNSDLAHWIFGAFTFARRVAEQEKETLARVLSSFGHARLREGHKIVQDVLERIDSDTPHSMIKEVVRWYEETNGSDAPGYYGNALERVIECIDMAVWLGWSPEMSNVPDISSKRGFSM